MFTSTRSARSVCRLPLTGAGRLAAAIQRAGLKVVISAWALWVLLFADDYDLAGERSTYKEAMLGFIWWLVVLSVPLPWKKSKGGFTYSWIGYEKSVREWSLGVSASRAEWAIKWMGGALQEGRVGAVELREALGRLVFAYGALTYDKPFLGPLFAFLSLHPPGVNRRLPLYVRVVLGWLRDRLKQRRTHKVVARRALKRPVLRVDAKAEGLSVAVGGWSPHYDSDGRIRKESPRWFSVELTERDAPWAFVKGIPARAISRLELLATTLGLVLLNPVELSGPGVAP